MAKKPPVKKEPEKPQTFEPAYIDRPCECPAHPFAHYHKGSSPIARKPSK